MRDLTTLDRLRDGRQERKLYGVNGGATEGLFRVPFTRMADGRVIPLTVIASCGEGWEHVSVSHASRTPTWTEMEYIKRLFFEDHETAMQLHVPPTDHVNCHPFCLHLWRPIGVEIPRPPPIMVGPTP